MEEILEVYVNKMFSNKAIRPILSARKLRNLLQNIVQNTWVKLINKLITQAVSFYSFVQMSGVGVGGGGSKTW